MRWLLTGNADGLAHLSIDRCLGWTTVVRNTLLLRVLVHLDALAFVVSLALSLILLLLSFPLLANFLEFCNQTSVVQIEVVVSMNAKVNEQGSTVTSLRLSSGNTMRWRAPTQPQC